jgi:RNA polymerase sigma-70 factor (ECF subfamily)
MMAEPDNPISITDEASLGRFVQESRRPLLVYIDRNLGPALRKKVEPEDILQEVTVSALASLDPFLVPGRDPFRLLCQMAEQRIIDAHRHHTAQRRSSERERELDRPAATDASANFVDWLVASMTSASQAYSRNQRELQLALAVEQLSPEQQTALRLRYVEQLPTKEIAARLGKTDGAIRVLLSRTVAELQDRLGAM